VKKVLRILGFAGIAVGVLAYPLAFALDSAAGVDALVVTAADDATVEVNRATWDGKTKSEVPGLYGSPFKAPERIVFANKANLIHPKEDPSQTLYLLRTGDHPLQAQTLFYFALPSTIGGLVAGAALLWLACRMGKKAEAQRAG